MAELAQDVERVATLSSELPMLWNRRPQTWSGSTTTSSGLQQTGIGQTVTCDSKNLSPISQRAQSAGTYD